jgi:hypothetical protein
MTTQTSSTPPDPNAALDAAFDRLIEAVKAWRKQRRDVNESVASKFPLKTVFP